MATTLGLAASLVSSPAHAQPNLPDSVIECVARELGPAAAQQIQTQRANAEQEAVSLLANLRPSEHDAFITAASAKDIDNGWSTRAMSYNELLRYLAGRRFRLIR